jgi:membrane protease YdiL (CAAX protease family)
LTVTGKSLGLGVLCLLMTLPVVNTVSVLGVAAQQWFSGKEIPTNLAHPVLKSLTDNSHSPWAWIMAGIAVLIAPIQEEIVFRGFLQTSILRLTGRPWLSVLIASAVFGAAHLGGEVPWYAVVSVFVLGLAMGLAFEKTRSLGTSIAMHIGFNAVNVAIALVWG